MRNEELGMVVRRINSYSAAFYYWEVTADRMYRA